jgi:hypothetical protein
MRSSWAAQSGCEGRCVAFASTRNAVAGPSIASGFVTMQVRFSGAFNYRKGSCVVTIRLIPGGIHTEEPSDTKYHEILQSFLVR